MYGEIIERLHRIEAENNIRILYACESGSRAWGFGNAESDWDIRFIFIRNDIRDYVSLSPKSDVIEYMEGDLDIVGWDVGKALILHHKSNPNLREWLVSPIKYIDWQDDIFKGLPDFDKSVLKYHYTSIAYNNWKKLGQKDLKLTKKDIKMFLYNCRCVLIWKVIDSGKNPSINIFHLLNQVELDGNTESHICSLIEYYRNNCQDTIDEEVINIIKLWLHVNLRIMKNDFPEKRDLDNFKIYDERFFEIISQSFEI